MKKLCALLLTAVMVIGFAGCNSAKPTDGDATDPTAAETITTEVATEITTADEAASEQPITQEPTTEEPTTEEPTTAVEEEATLADPTTLSKTELVEWYNERINYVRTQRPKFSREGIHKIDKFETSLLGGAADGLINNIAAKSMPGTPELTVFPKGTANSGEFLADTASSAVRASDVISATARREGGNYTVVLTLGQETNPAKKGASKYSRVFNIASAKEIMDGVAEAGITGDPNNATLVYSNGKVTITVNPQGEIIKAVSYTDLAVSAKDVKVSVFKLDLTVYEISSNTYSGFVY